MKPAAVEPDAQSHVPHCAHCIYVSNAGPFVRIYYCSQFAPLVIFFLLFLAVVKNTKIPHFVRFNCMQSVMIDIIVMLFTIIRSYFPSELRWTAILTVHFSSILTNRAGNRRPASQLSGLCGGYPACHGYMHSVPCQPALGSVLVCWFYKFGGRPKQFIMSAPSTKLCLAEGR